MPGPSPPPGLRAGQLGTLHLWALGVGIVVCGQYFGWNLGLAGIGPVGFLLGSLVVCLLFLAWVLTLAELSVALPDAGGPLAYGRRAGGPWLGFAMAWAMFLECLFGTIATALATGWYVAFLVDPAHPEQYPGLIVLAGLATVVVFFALQVWGVREQSAALVAMTYAALIGLVVYWLVAATNFAPATLGGEALLQPGGWSGVLRAMPYALWWLIIIEGVALAAEEAHEPARTIPRGLVLAMLTVLVLIVLTLLLGCGAMPWAQIDGDYPLAKVVTHVLAGRAPVVLYLFASLALFGLVASYHGLLYTTSRQLYALGRDGYLPAVLGLSHATRRTPVVALTACSGIVAVAVVASLWLWDAIKVAVLGAGLAALVWYVLAMVCLLVLRRREPGLFRRYRAPLRWTLPLVVVLLSVLVIGVFPWIDHAEKVLGLLAGLYLLGLLYFAARGRPVVSIATPVEGVPEREPTRWFDWTAAVAVWLAVGAVGWVVLAAWWPEQVRFASESVEAACVGGVLVLALALVSVVAWRHTQEAS